jgi:hypothetical protein
LMMPSGWWVPPGWSKLTCACSCGGCLPAVIAGTCSCVHVLVDASSSRAQQDTLQTP